MCARMMHFAVFGNYANWMAGGGRGGGRSRIRWKRRVRGAQIQGVSVGFWSGDWECCWPALLFFRIAINGTRSSPPPPPPRRCCRIEKVPIRHYHQHILKSGSSSSSFSHSSTTSPRGPPENRAVVILSSSPHRRRRHHHHHDHRPPGAAHFPVGRRSSQCRGGIQRERMFAAVAVQ